MKSGELLLRCKVCGNLVAAKTMHYTPDFKLICDDCYKKLFPPRKSQSITVKKPLTLKVKEKQSREWWICNFCNYKFSVKQGKTPLKCPMCGRSNIEKLETFTEKLVQEAITYDQEFDEN